MIRLWHLFALVFLVAIAAAIASAATTNVIGAIVQVAEDGSTIPPNTIATPQQVESTINLASNAREIAQGAAESASHCRTEVTAIDQRITLYSTNYLIKSVAYCEGVGGQSFDASNQVLRIYYGPILTATSVVIRGVVKINPLGSVVPPLDFRTTLDHTATWTNTATYRATEISKPAEYATYAKAYEYTIARPASGSLFIRMVDRSSGISGSGYYWLVFGDIVVSRNGQFFKGITSVETNIVAGVTNIIRHVSGLRVHPDPLAGL